MNSTTANIVIAALLLAANAFFVAAEFALVKTRGFRIRTLAEQNRFGARLVQRIMGDIEAYLACCQLGITMACLFIPTRPRILYTSATQQEKLKKRSCITC